MPTETRSDADDQREKELQKHLAEQRAKVPPMLYLPTNGRGEGRFAEVEMRGMQDGRTALLAYTALDRLHTCCGAGQPWALMETARLGELEQTQPYDVIYLDMELPQELRREADEADEAAVDVVDDAERDRG